MALSSSTSLLGGSVFVLALVLCGLSVSLALNLHRARPEPDWIEYGFLVLMLGLALAMWLGLIFASLGWFSLERLSAALGFAALVGFVIGRRHPAAVQRFTPGLVRPNRVDGALIGLLVACSVTYFRPHEFVFGAADAGVYVNMGAHIARTGSLLVYDEEVARLDRAAYPGLFREQQPGSGARYYHFPGFYLSDSRPGLVIPQFFALQAVSIAIFTSIGGVQAGLYATPMWGVLGVAAVYFFARSLFGRRAAFLAAILLGFTPTQNWFARYPTAEVLTQACLFAGLYALSRALARNTPAVGWGILAGLWIGFIFLARIDMILVAVVLIGALIGLALIREWHSGLTAFVITFGLMSIHSVVHAFVLAWPYTWGTYRSVFSALIGDRWPWFMLGAIAALFMVGFMVRAFRRLDSARRARFAKYARASIIVVMIVAAGYTYFIRPYREAPQAVVNWYDASNVVITNHENLVRIGWYVTPLGLAVALGGLCAMCWRERSVAIRLFVAIGLLSTVVYVANILNNPHQIYAMRRYVPVVIPAIVVWGAYGLAAASRVRDRRVVALAAIAAVGWFGGMLWQSRIIGRQVDDAGALDALVTLDHALEKGSIVLMDDQSVVGLGDVIGTPLRYIFDHPVFVLRAPEALPPGWLAAAVEGWQRQGRQVYLVSDATKALSLIGSLSVTHKIRFAFEVSILEPTYTQFPDRVVPVRYDLNVYAAVD